MDSGERTTSAGVALSMVLIPTDAARGELTHPQAGLSLPQRKLLSKIDGKRQLAQFVGTDTAFTSERIGRDALRLLTLGLARSDDFVLTRPVWVDSSSAATDAVTRSPQSAPQSLPMQSAAVAAKIRRRRRPLRMWAGGAGVFIAVAVAVVMFRPSSTPVGKITASAAVAQPVRTTAVEPPAPTAKATVTDDVMKPHPAAETAPAAEPSRVAPADSPARTFEPRAIVAGPKPDQQQVTALDNRTPAKAAMAAAQNPSSSAVLTPATMPVRLQSAGGTELNRAAPTGASADRGTSAQPLPQAAAPSTQANLSPSARPDAQAAQPAAPTIVAAAPAFARPTPPAPRVLLPQERDFAPTDSDPEQLALQAAGRAPLQRTPPIFPRDAIRQGLAEGTVRARLIIAADGTVERVETSVADARYAVFERPARAALTTWVFVPGAAGRVHETVLRFRAP